jgi:hypothetical protein
MVPTTTTATDSDSGRDSLAAMLRRIAVGEPRLQVAWEVAPDGTARCVFQILAKVPK